MNGEYFKRFVFYRFISGANRRPLLRMFLFLFSIYVVCFLAAWHDGLLVIPGGSYGLFEDIALYAQLISLFFVVAYATKLPKLFVETFKGSDSSFHYNSGIFQSIQFNSVYKEADYEGDFQRSYGLITAENGRGRLFLLSLMVFGGLANILTELEMYKANLLSWAYQGTYPVSFAAVTLLNVCIWWFIYPETVFIISTTLWGLIGLSRKLSQNDVILLSPVSRDEHGGFIALTRFCLHFVKLLSFPLLFLFSFISMYGFKIELTIGLMFYTLLLSVTFLWPLTSIHHSMRKCRERELLKVEMLFKKFYTRYQKAIREGVESNKEVNEISETFASIETLFSITKRLPLWPYNWNMLSKFISIIIIPLSAIVMDIATNSDTLLARLERAGKIAEWLEKGNRLFDFFH